MCNPANWLACLTQPTTMKKLKCGADPFSPAQFHRRRSLLKSLAGKSLLFLTLLSLGHAEVVDIGPLDETLTHPENPVARNFGKWDGEPNEGGTTLNENLSFRKNGYLGMFYDECTGYAFMHPQHVVRLPNKNGRAYFAVTTSDNLGISQFKTPGGRLTIYKTDEAPDPITDLIPPSTRPDGTHGEIIFERMYNQSHVGGLPTGAWNHPCKMEMIGNLLLVCVQQFNSSSDEWYKVVCGDYGEGSDPERLLFYDVRDPEAPKYWGSMDQGDLGNASEISDVGLVKIGDRWIMSMRGLWWHTQTVSPDISQWELGGGGDFSGQHGQNFNSFELYDPPSSAPAGTISPGIERVMWGDGGDDEEDDLVGGDEFITFNTVVFGPVCGAIATEPYATPQGSTRSLVPSIGYDRAVTRLSTHLSSAPNLFPKDKDYDGCGVYVSGGVPIIYAPIEDYLVPQFLGLDVFYSTVDIIAQVWNPANVRRLDSLMPVISVQYPTGTPLVDGAANVAMTGTAPESIVETFTIKNLGPVGGYPLEGVKVWIDGADAGNFSVTQPNWPIAQGSSTTFIVTFSPNAEGISSANLHVANYDSLSDPFVIALTGTATEAEIAIERTPGTPLERSENQIVGWGENAWGQSNTFPLSGAVAVAAGRDHSLALLADGTVYAWGKDSYGKATVPAELTVPVGVNKVIAIAAGQDHSLALMADGSVVKWGRSYPGEALVPEYAMSGVTAIAAGRVHSVALKDDGSVFNWGGTNCELLFPENLLPAIGISARSDLSMVLQANETTSIWGDYSPYVFIPDDFDRLTAVAAGNNHALGLRNDNGGTVVAWGLTPFGAEIVPPAALGGVSAIDAGSFHSLALKDDGTVLIWGDSDPIPAGLTDVSAIAAGDRYSLAVAGGVDPTTSLGSTNVGTTGAPQIFTIKNTGSAPLNLSSVAITGDDSSDFSLDAAGMLSVVPAGSETAVSITFTPGAAGVRTTVLRVVSNDIDESVSNITLNGTGTVDAPEIVIEEAAGIPLISGNSTFDMGSQAPSGGGVEKTFTIKNTGVDPLLIHDLVITGSASFLPLSGLLETSIPGGGQSTFEVRFSPSLPLGVQGATLSILSNDGDEAAFAIGLSGSVVETPELVLERQYGSGLTGGVDVIDFGNQAPGSASFPKTYTLRNTGSEILTISGISMASGDIGDFVVDTTGMLVSLPPGEETTFMLTFVPTALGARSAGLQILSNDLDEGVFDLSLIGTGIAGPELVLEETPGIPLVGKGSVLGWGWANGNTVPQGLSEVRALAASSDLTMAVLFDGTVMGWGPNFVGNAIPPVGLSGVTDVQPSMMALKEDGTVEVWGSNSSGQIPFPAGLSAVREISAGGLHSMALKDDGTVVAWGDNGNGQSTIPPGLIDVGAIAAGGFHSVALKNNGTVEAWGASNRPITGEGTHVPGGLTDVIAIAAGSGHTLALKIDGTVVAWGNNLFGQSTPPEGLTGVCAIEAYGFNSVALKHDGTVVMWGDNGWGQMILPVGLSGVNAVSTGYRHSVAVLGSRSVFPHQVTGTTSIAKTFTIKNPGTVPLNVSEVRVVGGANTNFTVDTAGMLTTVPAGGQTTFTVSFAPSNQIAYSSHLRVVTNDSDEPVSEIELIGVGILPPEILVEQPVGSPLTSGASTVDLGAETITYETEPTIFTISNTGSGPLLISSVELSGGDDSEFLLDLSGTLSNVPPGGSTSFTVVFAPSTVGARSTTLRILSNDVDESSSEFPLTGTGLEPPEIVVEYPSGTELAGGTPVDFGTQQVGSAGPPRTITVSNTGVGPLILSGVTTVGGAAADFIVAAIGFPVTVPSGGFFDISVAFHPSLPGLLGTSLQIISNDSDEASVSVSLVGTGTTTAPEIVIEESPGSLVTEGMTVEFGDVGRLQASLRTFILRNVGAAPLTISSLELADRGANGADFFTLDTTGMLTSILPGGQTTFDVSCTPTLVAARTAWLRVNSNDPDESTTELILRGVGIYVPELVVEHPLGIPLTGGASSIDFGPQGLNVPSTAKTFTVRNDASVDPLVISDFVVETGDAGDFEIFSILQGNGLNLLAGGETTFTVVFTPTGSGARQATLRILTTDPLQPVFDVTLTGSGYSPEIVIEGPGGASLISSVVVRGWGADNYGQATAPASLTDVVAVSADHFYSLALKGDGSVVAWGTSSALQLGIPVGLGSVIEIAAEENYAMALQANGTVVVWGIDPGLVPAISVPAGLIDVRSIAAGETHCLAVKDDGTVETWGLSTASFLAVPSGLGDVKAVAAGRVHSLALKEDGSVVAWGNNDHGQSTVPAGIGEVVAIAAGLDHSVALQANGIVVAWGNDSSGQSTVPPGLSNVVAIAAKEYQTVALKDDGTVVAWGNNGFGQSVIPAEVSDVRAIAAGHNFNLAVIAAPGDPLDFGPQPFGIPSLPLGFTIRNEGDGPLEVAGLSLINGDAGDFAITSPGIPGSVPVGGDLTFSVIFTPSDIGSRSIVLRVESNDDDERNIDIALTGTGTFNAELVLEESPGTELGDGSVLSFGDQISGSTTSKLINVRNAGTNSLSILGVSIVGGDQSLFTVDTSGMTTTVLPGGETSFSVTFRPETSGGYLSVLRVLTDDIDEGTLNLNLSGSAYSPAIVVEDEAGVVLPLVSQVTTWATPWAVPSGLGEVVALSIGANHYLALKNDGTVVGWGGTSNGTLTPPTGLGMVSAISAGDYHSMALLDDGTVVAWGKNADNQSTVPPGLNTVTAISAGAFHSLALKDDGTVVAWGRDTDGQATVPPGLDDVVAISAGNNYNLALKDDGTVVAWGSDVFGQSTVPGNLTGVQAISAGDLQALVLKDDGTVEEWGYDDAGQTAVPPGLEGVTAIAAGSFNNLALTADGTIVGWGTNGNGALNIPNIFGRPTVIDIRSTRPGVISEVPVFDLGARGAYDTSEGRELSILNPGDGPLTITGITLEGNAAGAFTLDTTATLTTLPGGAWTSLLVKFAPTVTGPFTADLRIASDSPDDGDLEIRLIGEGISVPAAVIEHPIGFPLVSGAAAISFGSEPIGVTSAAKTFTITNTGPVPLNISSAILQEQEVGDFALDTSGMLTSIPPGGQTTLSVTFTPTDSGPRRTFLGLFSDGVDGGVTVITITGTGMGDSEIDLQHPLGTSLVSGASSVIFGTPDLVSTPSPKTFTVTNSGPDSLYITSVNVTGGDSAEFILNTAGMLSLVPSGGSTTFTATFLPSAVGSRTTTLEVISDDADEGLYSVSLFGAVGNVVTTLADSGAGSLRVIIAAATPGDGIVFDPTLDGGTIRLAGSNLSINQDLIIDASSLPNGISISGDVTDDGATPDDSRVMVISGGASVDLVGLTIMGGNTTFSGGGIWNLESSLTLTDSTLSGNFASKGGGLYNSGAGAVTSMIRCLVIGNTATSEGGGVNNSSGVMTIDGSTFTNNTSLTDGGGGMFDRFSTLGSSVRNSTFTGNSAVFGAGIYRSDGDFEITNCTVFDNHATTNAGGGLYTQLCNVTITHSTFVGNTAGGFGGGGLLLSGGTTVLANSVVAGNTSPAGPTGADIRNLSSLLTTLGGNVIGDNTSVTAEFPEDGVFVGGNTLALVNPLLAPIGSYGGTIETMPPLPGSPCIEGASLLAGTPALDQRGRPRPSGPLPDLGAVEAAQLSHLVLIDSDGDGIDDRLELAYSQLTVGVDDRALDSDGDGSPDGEELANMTDPNDPNDKFKVSSFTKGPGFDPVSNRVFEMTIATFPGLQYELEMDSGLTNFLPIPGSDFIADGFSTTLEVQVTESGGFIRAKRN